MWSSESLMNELSIEGAGSLPELKSDAELIDQLLPPGPTEDESEPDHVECCENVWDFFTLPRRVLMYMSSMISVMAMLFIDVLNLGHELLCNRS